MPFKDSTIAQELDEHRKIIRQDVDQVGDKTPYFLIRKGVLRKSGKPTPGPLILFGERNQKVAKALKEALRSTMETGVCMLDPDGRILLHPEPFKPDVQLRDRKVCKTLALLGVLARFGYREAEDDDAPQPQPQPQQPQPNPNAWARANVMRVPQIPLPPVPVPVPGQPDGGPPPVQPQPQPQAPGPVLGGANREAAADFLRERRDRQLRRLGRLRGTLEGVQKRLFARPQADELKKGALRSQEWRGVTTALKEFETGKTPDQARALLAQLNAAQAVAAGWDKARKESPDGQKQLGAIATLLKATRGWLMEDEFNQLPAPLWDTATDARAADLYARMLFEEGDRPAQKLGKQSANGTFWVDKVAFGDTAQDNEIKHTFIFKPMDREGLIDGFPQGGSAPREALAKMTADTMRLLLNLDFGVPETQLTSLPNDRVDNSADKAGQDRLGSIQHFAKSEGDLMGLSARDPNIVNLVPDEDVHTMAIMDLAMLNLDRHSGNFMLRKETGANGGGDAMRLVPIDHGLTFPSREGLQKRRQRFFPPFPGLSDMPSFAGPFSDDMKERIAGMDPDKIAGGMRKARANLQQQQPGLPLDELLPEENIRLAQRSMQFLKLAAPELNISDIYSSLGLFTEDIFDSSDEDFPARAAQVIQRAQAHRVSADALRQQVNLPADEVQRGVALLRIMGDIRDRGFLSDCTFGEFTDLMKTSPELVRQLLDPGTVNQDVKLRMEALMAASSNEEELLQHARDGGRDACESVSRMDKDALAKAVKQLDKDALAVDFARLGGDAAFQQVKARYDRKFKSEKLADKTLLLRKHEAYQNLGGDDAFFGLLGDSQFNLDSRIAHIRERRGAQDAVRANQERTPQEKEAILVQTQRHQLARLRRTAELLPDAQNHRSGLAALFDQADALLANDQPATAQMGEAGAKIAHLAESLNNARTQLEGANRRLDTLRQRHGDAVNLRAQIERQAAEVASAVAKRQAVRARLVVTGLMDNLARSEAFHAANG